MKMTHRVGLLLTALLGFGLGTVNILAGDVTADNLTVYQDLTVENQSTGSAPTNELLFYYSFDTNTVPVPDGSGNGNTGTVSGATWVTNGTTDGAYSFDGTNDYITPTNTVFGTYWSIGCWIRKSVASTTNTLLDFNNGTTLVYLRIGDGAMAGKAALAASGSMAINGSNRIDDGYWHHVVGVRDNTIAYLYVDGVLAGTDSSFTTASFTSTKSRIGIEYWASVYYFPFSGSLDEVRVYSRALTEDEVGDLYRHDAHLTSGSARFKTGVVYLEPLGDLSMGVYTNDP